MKRIVETITYGSAEIQLHYKRTRKPLLGGTPSKPCITIFIKRSIYYHGEFNRLFWTQDLQRILRQAKFKWEYSYDRECLDMFSGCKKDVLLQTVGILKLAFQYALNDRTVSGRRGSTPTFSAGSEGSWNKRMTVVLTESMMLSMRNTTTRSSASLKSRSSKSLSPPLDATSVASSVRRPSSVAPSTDMQIGQLLHVPEAMHKLSPLEPQPHLQPQPQPRGRSHMEPLHVPESHLVAPAQPVMSPLFKDADWDMLKRRMESGEIQLAPQNALSVPQHADITSQVSELSIVEPDVTVIDVAGENDQVIMLPEKSPELASQITDDLHDMSFDEKTAVPPADEAVMVEEQAASTAFAKGARRLSLTAHHNTTNEYSRPRSNSMPLISREKAFEIASQTSEPLDVSQYENIQLQANQSQEGSKGKPEAERKKRSRRTKIPAPMSSTARPRADVSDVASQNVLMANE